MRNTITMSIATICLGMGALLSATAARADGFFCEGENTGLKISVLNHNQPTAGTRTPETLSITNPALSPTEQVLVVFSDRNQTLNYQGYGSYFAKVDLRTIEPSRADVLVAGVPLKELKSVLVDIRFSYDPATSALARIAKSIPGKATYQTKNGDDREEKLVCKRYIKSAQ